MNHFTWKYVGDAGFSANVGLYHSSKTGHLMAYVDQKVIIVDFNIRDTKDYTFFINDELCAIKLERKKDRMHYHFEIDKKTDTPRNRARKKIEKKHFRQTLMVIGGLLVALAGIAFYFSSTLKTQEATVDLLKNPKTAVARVEINEESAEKTISYFFVADHKSINTKTKFPANFTGMPIESGDEFLVQYAATNPTVNKIDFALPSDQQIKIYLNRVLEKHTQLHPELSQEHIKCRLNIAYEIKGKSALADFYFQEVSPSKNAKHNQNTYLRLTRDLPFQNRVKEECW